MAKVSSITAIDFVALNFNNIYRSITDFSFEDGANTEIGSKVYQDAVGILINPAPGTTTNAIAFLGKGMAVSGNTITAGTVQAILSGNDMDDGPSLFITGLTLSAKSLYAAFKTTSTADDIAIQKTMFAASDTFSLSAFADVAHGYDGNDTMAGNAGNDRLYGDAGNDKINGGRGVDKLYGGSGADVFIFDDGHSGKTAASRDTIYDFVKGTDDLDLRLVDADTSLAGDQAFTYSGRTASSHGVWYGLSGEAVVVQMDRTGDGISDMQIKLNAVSSLTAADFLL